MDSKTNWEKIVTGQELSNAKKYRAKQYVEKKERRIALPELIEEGWEEYKAYKNPKYVGVRMRKPFFDQFEDNVWLLFARMGFTYMNSDREFIMSYDYQNPNHTQQIDVFAADEECIIIVECKSSETRKEGVFKKDIEALHGQMEGLMKEARKKFPGRKIKFIWATQNYILSRADKKRLDDWGIMHFGDAAIEYYSGLVKHLGAGAKYQLLGNLFANVEIKNMEDRIPAIQGKMGGFTYYSFSIEPERLLKICYVLHRNEANKNMMPTYQRLIKKARLTAVQHFVAEGGYFPNSLIISIDTNSRGIQFDQSPTKVEESISKLGVLHLPKRYRSAYIIDGQHRLYGYSGSPYATSNSIPVVAFVDLDRSEQIKLFMDINENQKAVDKNLRVILNADLLWDSDNYNEQRQALRSKIAQMLGEEETSPLLGRVIVGQDENTSEKCISADAIQAALKQSHFLTVYDKKNAIVSDGTFDLGSNQKTCDLLYPFLEDCLKYIQQHSEIEWNKGDAENGLVTMNRGIQAIIRVIDDIVVHLCSTGQIKPKSQNLDDIVKEVVFYLDPLIAYLNNVTEEQRKDLRGYFGSGAIPRFWRTYQKAIADVRRDFQPDGLSEYWLKESKQFNKESIQYLHDIEVAAKSLISSALKKYYGDNWEIKALPRTIYSSAKQKADDQTYDSIKNGHIAEPISIWDCVTLADCKSIATTGNHWTEIFEDLLTRPEEKNISGGKSAKTEWLAKMSAISNKLMKPNYSVSKEDYETIKSIYDWLRIL